MSKRRVQGAVGLFVLAVGAIGLSPHAVGDPSSDSTLVTSTSEPDASIGTTTAGGSAEDDVLTVPSPAQLAAQGSKYAIAVPQPLPPLVAIAVFENRSKVKSLDWLGPAAAFITGELIAAHSGVRTAFGPLVIPRTVDSPATPDEIVSLAARSGARFVVTGSYSRPDWELELRLELWEITGSSATRAGLMVNRGDFKFIHKFIAKSLMTLFDRVELPVAEGDLEAVDREPTKDFYAFTLFGRGLSAMRAPTSALHWKTAKKNLERAVHIDPTFIEGQRMVGQLYRELAATRYARAVGGKNLEGRAAARFVRALEARPDYTAASVALAARAEKNDRPERARDLYATVVRARPYDFEARFRLGKVLWDVGEADDSYQVLSELVKFRPDDVRARRILVMIHSARGSGEALVSELEKVARLDPSDDQTRMDLGAAYAAVERNDDAIDVYRGLAAKNSRSNSHNKSRKNAALKFLGDLHKKIGKRDEAIKYYGLALEAKPSDPRPYFNLGALYVEAGEDDKARRIYQRAQRFRSYAPEIHTNLGAIAFRARKVTEALAHHRKAVLASPRRARFRYNLALALSADGQLDQAASELGVGLRYDPKHIGLNYLKGVVLLRGGDVEAASIQFEKTLEIEPEHEDALHNLALLEELRRRADEGELVKERRL